MKFRVIFTLDYEIHGNGHGSPRDLMVEPTERMMAQFDRHGAKLTVMADVAEILRFKRHLEEAGLQGLRCTALAPDPQARGPILFAATARSRGASGIGRVGRTA